MAFILFMTCFALALILILWLIFRSGKSSPTKKIKSPPKKKSQKKKVDTTPVSPTGEQLRDNAIKLLKKNPKVVSQVVRQWLREK